MDYDVFISHASEDKSSIARPLAEELTSRGLRVWFDESVLTIGDSLRRKIDEGLSKSRYGIVILSPSFFKKEWPNRELDGLTARDIDGAKVILPVWHNVAREDIAKYSPTLADRLAVSTSYGIEHVADQIIEAIKWGYPSAVIAVTTAGSSVSLSTIRTSLITASCYADLRRCLHEIVSYLRRNPDNVDAQMLRDSILVALRHTRLDEAPRGPWRRRPRMGHPLLLPPAIAGILFLVLITYVMFLWLFGA